MWATAAEAHEHFVATTRPHADYRVRDCWDNGEFITGATVDLLLGGEVVATETFTGSSEFEGDADATTKAISFAVAWVESQVFSLEERIGPYGVEWQREQAERTNTEVRGIYDLPIFGWAWGEEEGR